MAPSDKYRRPSAQVAIPLLLAFFAGMHLVRITTKLSEGLGFFSFDVISSLIITLGFATIAVAYQLSLVKLAQAHLRATAAADTSAPDEA
ncbi:hypothetical protein DV532_27005 (plasmid) [Pseudomonas sp. Leaf58]|uniref:hypothetical protein n=1 Tax=Pseudomonas sp. Leaf58 TaxID=1736226 RepID=UPI0006F5EC3E|nr:hypothetical protein [Pseudomonas sp. Leaf58]AYG47934.1 hypothetical protein DV532_27005 [Pseudomonas sp. Leaf58]KQN62503.1 hypothetical protein ASF02_10165 [Pseudomonas sp. Leaf58]